MGTFALFFVGVAVIEGVMALDSSSWWVAGAFAIAFDLFFCSRGGRTWRMRKMNASSPSFHKANAARFLGASMLIMIKIMPRVQVSMAPLVAGLRDWSRLLDVWTSLTVPRSAVMALRVTAR